MKEYAKVRFSGRLGRAAYSRHAIAQFLACILGGASGLGILELLNAEQKDSPPVIQWLAVFVFVSATVWCLYFLVAMIGSVSRRANDTNHTVLWRLIGLLVPYGMVLICLPRSARAR